VAARKEQLSNIPAIVISIINSNRGLYHVLELDNMCKIVDYMSLFRGNFQPDAGERVEESQNAPDATYSFVWKTDTEIGNSEYTDA
jgi:hypothetical protein